MRRDIKVFRRPRCGPSPSFPYTLLCVLIVCSPHFSPNGPMDSRAIAPFLFFLVLPPSLVLLCFQVSAIRLSRRRGHISRPSLRLASASFIALATVLCSTISIIGTLAYVARGNTSRATDYSLGEGVSVNILRLMRKLQTFVCRTLHWDLRVQRLLVAYVVLHILSLRDLAPSSTVPLFGRLINSVLFRYVFGTIVTSGGLF